MVYCQACVLGTGLYNRATLQVCVSVCADIDNPETIVYAWCGGRATVSQLKYNSVGMSDSVPSRVKSLMGGCPHACLLTAID